MSFKVHEVKLAKHEDGLIRIKFSYNGRHGMVEYNLIGDAGISYLRFPTERNGEDVYAVIHDWVEKHISYSLKIKVDKKVVL